MKTEYTIEPRVKKRWFKNNEMYYDLVRHSEEGKWIYNGVDIDYILCPKIQTIFSSKNIKKVLTIKKNLER